MCEAFFPGIVYQAPKPITCFGRYSKILYYNYIDFYYAKVRALRSGNPTVKLNSSTKITVDTEDNLSRLLSSGLQFLFLFLLQKDPIKFKCYFLWVLWVMSALPGTLARHGNMCHTVYNHSVLFESF